MQEPSTLTIEQACRRLGISRNQGYMLAKRDGRLAENIPVIRLGHRLVIPTVYLKRALGEM